MPRSVRRIEVVADVYCEAAAVHQPGEDAGTPGIGHCAGAPRESAWFSFVHDIDSSFVDELSLRGFL